MPTLDLTQAQLTKLITHHVGNKTRDEKVKLSEKETKIKEETLPHLLKYFLSSFKPVDFYSFWHPAELNMNEIYTIVSDVFFDNKQFISKSKKIANILYNHSNHPKIKEGEMNIVYFKNVILDDAIIDAVGIFKSENNVPFLKMNSEEQNYFIKHEYGFEILGIDKGCLIFDLDKEDGFNILVIDNVNKSSEAQYWVNDFLQLNPMNDGYHKTVEFLGLTKSFITKNLPEELEIDQTDKIDLLNRTMNYFKESDTFNKTEFENTVFQDDNLISNFRNYSLDKITDEFKISTPAVRKQSRSYKSVLKLDKNFHVYIHGNRDLIKKGVESDGRKFYKIYYEKED